MLGFPAELLEKNVREAQLHENKQEAIQYALNIAHYYRYRLLLWQIKSQLGSFSANTSIKPRLMFHWFTSGVKVTSTESSSQPQNVVDPAEHASGHDRL